MLNEFFSGFTTLNFFSGYFKKGSFPFILPILHGIRCNLRHILFGVFFFLLKVSYCIRIEINELETK